MSRALTVLLAFGVLTGCSSEPPLPHEAIKVQVDWSQYGDDLRTEIDREIDNGMCNALQDMRYAVAAIHEDDEDLIDYVDQGIDIAC